MEALRFDHMCFLQTMLAQTTGDIEAHRNPVTAESYLPRLKSREKRLQKMIKHHG